MYENIDNIAEIEPQITIHASLPQGRKAPGTGRPHLMVLLLKGMLPPP